jgi:hypothetical protein
MRPLLSCLVLQQGKATRRLHNLRPWQQVMSPHAMGCTASACDACALSLCMYGMWLLIDAAAALKHCSTMQCM